jgi:2-keto-4-pentenoate hydratase/2-oxohepta-3-ene-1,7-dioic acid hydratase in catechol pathway
MIFDVTALIQHLSQFMVLSPGDVINTGTPQGVALSGRFPYLKAGDFMELEIDCLGRQRQKLTNAQS